MNAWTRIGLASLLALAISCARPTENREMNVVATDYAFTVADTVAPGRATVTFTNRGAVRHELSLARLKPGVTLRDVMQAQQQGKKPEDFLIGSGILIARPGETDPIGLNVDMKPGERYAMVCFFRDSASAPPHVALGMMKEVIVASR